MANENDVVRLKHLQPLVSGVANDFSIQNGDNAVRLKHLVSLATALDNDKQAPVLSLGSWSSADTVYSAPITYTGDGTLSTDIGTIANDILTVADEDGTFNGVISASAGNDFASSSLHFCRDIDTITIEGGNFKNIPTLQFISAAKSGNNITINLYNDSDSYIVLVYRNKNGTYRMNSYSATFEEVNKVGNNWEITSSDFRDSGTTGNIVALVKETKSFYSAGIIFSY